MMNLRTLGISALAGALLLAACASETPYGPRGDGRGYGFAEQRIESNRYRITFRGNSLTSRETVENYLLYRAAELTIQKGYDHFIVVEDDTEKSTSYRTTGGPDPYFYYGAGRRFPYYGYGFRWGPGFYDNDIREVTRYTAVAYILMYEGEKPRKSNAYDAESVRDNLREFIRRPEEG
jgi:hypothetical protein